MALTNEVKELIKSAKEVIDEAKDNLEKTSKERDEATEKVDKFESALKIANALYSKGQIEADQITEKVTDLCKKSSYDLDVIKSAVDMGTYNEANTNFVEVDAGSDKQASSADLSTDDAIDAKVNAAMNK